jgi:acetylornithine/succinyldiaminopimelate/putrescine aminotransferase
MEQSGGDRLCESPEVVRYARHVNPAFVRLLGVYGYGRLFVRARDVWVWDSKGRQYLDFLAGFGAVNLGHNHPRLRQRLHAFLDEDALNLCHVGPSTHAADLAEKLADLAGPLEVCLFSSSGAEAVEAGLKLARAVTGRASSTIAAASTGRTSGRCRSWARAACASRSSRC